MISALFPEKGNPQIRADIIAHNQFLDTFFKTNKLSEFSGGTSQ